MTHELKILPEYFKFVEIGEKKFELRKNDRGFKVGDTILLREWDPDSEYTGNAFTARISYVLEDCEEYGLKPGHCILSWKWGRRIRKDYLSQDKIRLSQASEL